jgi:hypothetical protein
MHILNTHELGYSFAQLALPVGKNPRHLTCVSFETASKQVLYYKPQLKLTTRLR